MRILFALFLSYYCLFAQVKNVSVVYDVSYGIFGKMGEAKTKVTTHKDRYSINVKAYATGVAKYMSGNLVETYESKGVVLSNKFIPEVFTKVTKKDDKIKTKKYTFDYKNKVIKLVTTTKEKTYTNNIDLNNLHKEREFEWKTSKKLETVKYWADEDILSLFFNISNYVVDYDKSSVQSIQTIGAGKSNNGKVDIIVPQGEDRKEIEDILDQKSKILIVKIYKDIFMSKSGELYIALNNNGICSTSVLKDVLFFGDVVGKIR